MPRLLVCLALLAFAASAQETRSVILGRVLDPQGTVIAGAIVTVTNTDTNATSKLLTNQTGYYEANLLLPGNYQITAEMTGFKKSIRSGIFLGVSSRVEINMHLQLGEVAESVTVTEEAPLLDTNGISSGRTMDNRNVLDLPTFNNSPLMLIKLTPGVQASNNRRYNGVNGLGGTGEAHNAGNVGGNDWSIDGVPNMGGGYAAAYLPYSTTIQEYKVETSNFDAAVGHTSGATISVMTKAGTNALHGNITWQHWQQRWNGTRFFVKQQYYREIAAAEAAGDRALADQLRNSPLQPSGHSNNYGATIGGPVVLPRIYDGRNKLFFFFSLDGFEDKKSAETGFRHTLPTMANREGDFSDLLRVNASRYQIYDPLTVRADPNRAGHYIRDPFAGNILPRSRMINPAYDAYTSFLPLPNNPPASPTQEPNNNYVGVGEPYNWSYKALANRVDYNLSEKHRFFGRWSWLRYREDRQDWTYETKRGLQTNGVNRNNLGITANWVWAKSGSTVIDANAAVNDFEEGNILSSVALGYKPTDFGLPAYMDVKAGEDHSLPIMDLDGYKVIGQEVPAFTHFQLASGKANILHIRGAHTLRAGLDVRNHMRFGGAPGVTSGGFLFDNSFTRREDDNVTPPGIIGHSWAAFYLGLPTEASVDTNADYALSNLYHGWYVQDNWRVTSKLSLNVGFRIEYEFGRMERYNRAISYFDRTATLPITAGAQAAYAANPIPELPASQFSVLGGSMYPGVNGQGRRLQSGELMWMPRIGAAYQINSRTVLRGGYGMFFDTINSQNFGPDQSGFSRTTINPVTNNFGIDWLSGNPGAGISPLTDPFPVRADGTRFDLPVGSALGLLARTGSGWAFMDYPTPQRARQHRWRVDLQRQLSNDVVVSVAYAGSYSDRVRVNQKLDSVPGEYWADGLTRNNALASNLNQNVPNPFYIGNFADLQGSDPIAYQALASRGFFTSPTIRKAQLLRAFPQMNGLTQNAAPVGEVKTHSMEAMLQKRFSRGFTFNFSYVSLYERDRDFFVNEFDPSPSWRPTNFGVPHRVAATGIWELPFGRGRAWLTEGIASKLFGGWQIAATYEWQPGPLLEWGNLFYYGDVADINTGERTLDRWFNTDGFERTASRGPAGFHRRVFPQRVDGLRADGLNRIDANVQREFRIRENVAFQIRLDTLNLANRSQFSAPVRDPYSTDFGRVTSNTSSTMRFLLVQARLRF